MRFLFFLTGKDCLLVKFRGTITFIDGSSDAEVLKEVRSKFKALLGWILPSDALLLLSSTARVLRSEATFAEVRQVS